MAFYTATWARRLAKEESDTISKYVNKASNDFRDYIDANTPFVLWLDIGLLRERILNKPETEAWILDLAKAVVEDSDIDEDLPTKIYALLDQTYKNTIDAYAENPRYQKISADELDKMLTKLSTAEVGNVKQSINTLFNTTRVVTQVTKPQKSVMLILPKFTTLQFGKVFKQELEKLVKSAKWLKGSKSAAKPAAPSPLGLMLPPQGEANSMTEKGRFLLFVNENFGRLQNIGHVEVDVVSETEKIVKRGQNSPRLLQALVSMPVNDKRAFQRLQLKFSKETGQAATRIKIRKKFTSSKLIFELLVENGISVGIPETQADNLLKAKLEKAFEQGKGLSAIIRKDPTFLTELETSKSITQYVEENIFNILKTGRSSKPYSSTTNINSTSRISINKVKIVAKSPKSVQSSSLPRLRTRTGQFYSISTLQSLLDSLLTQTIKQNMGDGSRRDILNLRSGRFAESVKVERMSQSREGMITAFYTYMKNPYATFSSGGRQEFPKTRDPKLLIAKSIREIAAQKVANKLRAVSL